MISPTQNMLPPGFSLALALQDAADKGEVSPVTSDGRPSILGRLANKMLQPSTPGVSDAAGMARVAGGIAATKEAEKQKQINELLASMGQGQAQQQGLGAPVMPGGMQQQGQLQPQGPQAQPQGMQPLAMPGATPRMARGGIAQFADGGVALPSSVAVPTVEQAQQTASGIAGIDPVLLEEYKRAQMEAQRVRESLPPVRQKELEMLEKANAERVAMQEAYKKDAAKRNLRSFLQGYVARQGGGGGATYAAQKESDRQQGLKYIAQQEQYAAKLSAIEELQNAQKTGNAEAVLRAKEKLLDLDMEGKKGIAQLTGNLFQGNVSLFNSELDYLASRQNASDQIKLKREEIAAGRTPTGEVMLIMEERDNILKQIVPPGQTPTPEQRSAALSKAIATIRPAVSSKEGIAGDKEEARKFESFHKGLNERLKSTGSPYNTVKRKAAITTDTATKAKYEAEADRLRTEEARQVAAELGMSDEQFAKAMRPLGAPTSAAPGTVDRNNPLLK